jgi:hypothetical protein
MAVPAPVVPTFNFSALTKALAALRLQFDLSQLGLGIVMALVGIFFAVASVVLLYHWRRFPYEHQTLHRVERLYELVSILLIAVAVFGIFFAA